MISFKHQQQDARLDRHSIALKAMELENLNQSAKMKAMEEEMKARDAELEKKASDAEHSRISQQNQDLGRRLRNAEDLLLEKDQQIEAIGKHHKRVEEGYLHRIRSEQDNTRALQEHVGALEEQSGALQEKNRRLERELQQLRNQASITDQSADRIRILEQKLAESQAKEDRWRQESLSKDKEMQELLEDAEAYKAKILILEHDKVEYLTPEQFDAKYPHVKTNQAMEIIGLRTDLLELQHAHGELQKELHITRNQSKAHSLQIGKGGR